MALQGTIDSFPLIDVLALLESSKKTGRLEVVGDRGRGTLWVQNGELSAAEVHGSAEIDPVDAVWELLRFNDGSFEFATGEEPPRQTFTANIGDTVAAAQKMLAEWERITRNVPSLAHKVTLAEHLPGEDVRLSAEDWSVLVAAGPSRSVREVLEVLGASEFAGCAKLAELVDRYLVDVHEPVDTAEQVVAEQVTVDQAPADQVPEDEVPEDEVIAQQVVDEPAVVEEDPAEPVAAAPDDMPVSQRFAELDEDQPTAPREQADVVAEPVQEPESQTAQPVGAEPAAQVAVPGAAAVEAPMARGSAEPEPAQFPEHFPIDDLMSDEEGLGWEQAAESPQGDPVAQSDPVAQGVVQMPQSDNSMPTAIEHGAAVAGAAPDANGQPGAGGQPLHSTESDATVPQEQIPAADTFAATSNGDAGQAEASEDVLSQISRLSPKAAEAIAAALGDEGA